MSDVLTLSALRARGLPRQLLLLSPSPYVEVHVKPGGEPSAVSGSISRSTEPVWRTFSFSHAPPSPCAPCALALVVRDAANNAAILGRVSLSLPAAHVEGWFPLRNAPGELFLRISRPRYCLGRAAQCALPPPPASHPAPDGPAGGDLRSVSADCGFLFRTGELLVTVRALDVPAASKELFVALETDGQALRGAETPASLRLWRDRQAAEEAAAAAGSSDASVANDDMHAPEAGVEDEAALRPRANLLGKAHAAPKTAGPHRSGKLISDFVIAAKSDQKIVTKRNLHNLVSAAGSYALGLKSKRMDTGTAAYDTSVRPGQQEGSREAEGQEAANDSLPAAASGESRETECLQGPAHVQRRTGEGNNLTSNSSLLHDRKNPVDGVSSHNDEDDDDDGEDDDDDEEDSEMETAGSSQEKNTAADVDNSSIPGARRSAAFGSFRFALMQGIVPRMMHIHVLDKAAPLPAPLGLSQEHNIRIPTLADFTCSCPKQCNTHVFEIRLNGQGPGGVTVLLEVQYRSWKPLASSTDVTNRFLDIFSKTEKLPNLIRDRFSQAGKLTYLLVGGLFTQHYPGYFERNMKYLKEKLNFCNVKEVPIHTEGSIARNAKDIRDAIMNGNPTPKSVILIGHSKGGIDAVAVVKSFPEVIPFLYGIVTFQAPFGGTYLVEFVSRSKLAVNTISSAIEKLWKGDEAAFVDMGYTARLQSFGIRRNTANVSTEASNETVPSENDESSSTNPPFVTRANRSDGELESECLDYLRAVPIVAFASSASFDVLKIRSAANAAGVATMAPAAQVISQYTGFSCDGLVTAHDARIPFADTVVLDDMMHTEPALYVKGTNYPPGQLTASGLLLLFEKAKRRTET